MRKKIFLHIGLHKTGTTAFQQTIRRSSELICEQGFFVCPPGKTVPGNGGYHAIPEELKSHGRSDTLEEVLECFEKSNCPNAILSSEIFDTLEKDQIAKLSSYLEEYDVFLFIVLRHPISLLTSGYCSVGGYLRNRSPEEHCRKVLSKENSYFYFGKFVANWVESFPNFKVLYYENHSDIVTSLLKRMGVCSSIFNTIKLRNTTTPKNLIEASFKDGRARTSLSIETSLVNYLLSTEMKQMDIKKKVAIHSELIEFDKLMRRKSAANNVRKKTVLLSGNEQKKILKLLENDLRKVTKITKKPVPREYYLPEPGEVPNTKYLEKLYNQFIQFSSSFPDKSKKIIYTLSGSEMIVVDRSIGYRSFLVGRLKNTLFAQPIKKIKHLFTQS